MTQQQRLLPQTIEYFPYSGHIFRLLAQDLRIDLRIANIPPPETMSRFEASNPNSQTRVDFFRSGVNNPRSTRLDFGNQQSNKLRTPQTPHRRLPEVHRPPDPHA